MSDDALSRRRFLRGVSAAGLLGTVAGCSALRGGEPDPTIPAGALWAVVEDEPPAVPETVPVDIESAYLDGASEGTRETLATTPAPFTASEIPNGAIREELNHTHGYAVSLLEGASTAPSPFEALQRLRRARGEASALSAAWGAIDTGLTRAEVAERAPAIEAALTDFVERWEYVGDDRLRAAVVQSVLERTVHGAERNATVDAERMEVEPENPVTVGDVAGALGRARAAVDDVSHLHDRYVGSLDRPVDLHPVLEEAASTLVEDVEARRRELPEIDASNPSALFERDIDGTPAAEVLEDLYWRLDAADGGARELDAGRPANAVVRAHATLVRFRAFSATRQRVAEGASFEVETASDVEALRSEAVAAVEAARGTGPTAALTNRMLPRLADRLRDADRRLAPEGESVRTAFIEHDVAEYVIVAALARALPPTVDKVTGVLRSVRG